MLTIVQNLRDLVEDFSRSELCCDKFLVKNNGHFKGFLIGEKYVEIIISIFLGFGSSGSVRKSRIFEISDFCKLALDPKRRKMKIPISTYFSSIRNPLKWTFVFTKN